jgi:hypothetical protein
MHSACHVCNRSCPNLNPNHRKAQWCCIYDDLVDISVASPGSLLHCCFHPFSGLKQQAQGRCLNQRDAISLSCMHTSLSVPRNIVCNAGWWWYSVASIERMPCFLLCMGVHPDGSVAGWVGQAGCEISRLCCVQAAVVSCSGVAQC